MLKSVMKLEICCVTLSAFAFLILLGAGTAYGQIEIAELKDPDVVMGCSCSIQTAKEAKKPNSQKFLFLSELGTDDAWMNINGKDVKLTRVKSTENEDDEYKIGRRYYEEYSAKGIKVRIDYLTTWICPPEDEGCEVTKFDITITVTKGEASKALKAMGLCGC
jgi:hypothetical protein